MSTITQGHTPLTVVSVGLGKAGGDPEILHGAAWTRYLPDVGFNIAHIGYDADSERRTAAAHRIGSMTVLNSLENLPDALDGRTIDVLDITTSSGHHTNAMGNVLDILAGAKIMMPAAIACEKPLVSSAAELHDMESLLTRFNVWSSTFGIEHYLNSAPLRKTTELVRREQARGNDIASIMIDFSKDRVLDVRRGRFQDDPNDPSLLSSLGIEPPHMLSISNVLLGDEIDVRPQQAGGDILECRLYHDIHGIAESEGTYIRAMRGGTQIIIKQSLGPFRLNDSGVIKSHDWDGKASRSARVVMQDGSEFNLQFDPLLDYPRFYGQLEYKLRDDETRRYIAPDDSLPGTLRAIAQFAVRGILSDELRGMDACTALRRSRDLLALRAIGGMPVRVT